MKAAQANFKSIPMSDFRLMVRRFARLNRPAACSGIFELNVGKAESVLKRLRARSGHGVTLVQFLLFCIARTVERHPSLNTYIYRSNLIEFDDVDVCATAERRTGEERCVQTYQLRRAQDMSFGQIAAAMKLAARKDKPYKATRLQRAVFSIPLLCDLLARYRRGNPFWLKERTGTVYVSIMQTAGINRYAVSLPFCAHTFGFVLNPVFTRHGVDETGAPQRQRICTVTGIMDHDVLDGIDCMRAMRTLAQLVESPDVDEDAFVTDYHAMLAV